MLEKLRVLFLLLHKNFIVRKRHWIGSIIEIILPAFIIAMLLAVRSTISDSERMPVNESTYFPIQSEADIVNRMPESNTLHLYYKPRNIFTDNIIEAVTRCAKLSHDQTFGFDTEDDMLQSYEIQKLKDELISVFIIDFGKNDSETVPKKLTYTMRSSRHVPETLFDNEKQSCSKRANHLIDWNPVVAFQMCLDNAFINRTAPDDANIPRIVIQMMPCPPYDNIDPSELAIQFAIVLFAGVIFFATFYLIPSYISAEKTTGVNTLLKMNGVKSYQNFLSWLVSGMLFNIVTVFILTMLLKLNLYGEEAIYHNSDCSVIWFALFINIIHVYAFCLHVASYFSKAWLVQIVATSVPLLVNIVVTQLDRIDKFCLVPYLGILFPTAATMRIFEELNNHRYGLTGAQWSNLFESSHPSLGITGSLGFIMLASILGIIAHFIFAVYLDAVLPSKYSVQKPPLYFLECYKRTKVSDNDGAGGTQGSEGEPQILEPVAEGTLIPGIQLRNLTKSFKCGIFKSRTVDAVRGISLDFYKGQITALLGHNGAGKTTTFAILTGLTAPSSGTVHINGKDISNDLDTIRNDLGVCPQENIMFPDLTVLEQLRLIGLLKQKDQTRKQVIEAVDDILNRLALSEKKNVMPNKLSGGQKRRVCLGMALIGNASTIFLDEPTSGMDPETSRGTWDILLKYRKQKTIIITTHSMEEADVLGDRIAIMHSGQMKCYGTSMFLKKFYGHNYHEVTLSTTPNCDEEKIREMVGGGAKMKVTHHGRIVISIPFTSSLPEILDNMENNKAELGITGVSVSMITLEQVFLKAAEEEESSNEPTDCVDGIEEPIPRGYEYLTGSKLTWQKITTLLTKKVTYFRTDRNLFVAIICGALLAVFLPASGGGISEKTNSLSLDLGLYQSPETLIHSKDRKLGHVYKKIVESQGGTVTLTKSKHGLSNELLSRAVMDMNYYRTRMIVAAEFNSSSSANAFYSGGATLSAPITINAISNAVLKTVSGHQYSIAASIANIPRTLKIPQENKPVDRFDITIGIILFMAIFFHVVALFVKHPLLENSTKVKQLQRMAGVSSFLYWGTTFLIDYAVYILVTVLIVSGMLVMDYLGRPNNVNPTAISILLLLFLLFGINALLLAYIHSYMDKRFHLVYSILSGVPVFLVFIMIPVIDILPALILNEKVTITLRRVLSFVPHISFVFGYVEFAVIVFSNGRCRRLSNGLNEAACAIGDLCCDMKCSNGHCANPLPYFGNFSRDAGLEEFVMYLLLTPIILVAIIYWLEEQAFAKLLSKWQINRPKSKSQDIIMDSEVEKEKSIVRQAINEGVSDADCDDENVFLAYELSKCYGKLEAVKEVNFRVKKNECFGLLGVNGAGKSTTFRMLVGEEVPTSGILHRGSYSVKTNRAEYLAGMGYCPQNDALIPYFNSVEHLSLFARLRGIPAAEVKSEVHSWIDKLRLKKHARNRSGNYSGGNKRRLNIAMALIASPKMVLLDEPTTGVDPAARRSVWTVLQSCQASGQAIILTSHSMEECEALCNRLVIMVRGRLLCVGASQELKERFGAGFNITIKLNPGRSEQVLKEIKNRLQTSFVCELKDEHSGYLLYHITDPDATWVKMFGTMDNLKSEHECIEDFTVSTSTLEQLFMQFARSSTEPVVESQTPSQTTSDINSV